ncbi:hypothetical protein [Nitrosopumilus sp. S6]
MQVIVIGFLVLALLGVGFTGMGFSEIQESHITLDSHEITKTQYSTEVKKLTVIGYVSDYERGTVVHLLNVSPTGEITKFNTTGTNEGDFFTIIPIDGKFEAGEYQLVLEYDGKQIASTTYVII